MDPSERYSPPKAIFLDRDGVINSNRDRYYIWREEELELNPGVTETLKVLKKRGYLLIVISNQGGVGRGLYTREDVENFHRHLRSTLAGQGAVIDDFYYCPHHDEGEACLCRKPLPLMIEKAMARYQIDPALSWFIGDSQRDEDAAKTAGLRSIIVESNSNLREVLGKINSGPGLPEN